MEEVASFVSILSCGQRIGERCTKDSFNLLLHTAGIDVQKLYELRNDPGLREEFEGDTATDFEKAVRTLNAHFVTKLNEPYERHV